MEHQNIVKMKIRNKEESISRERESLPIPMRLNEPFSSLQTLDLSQNSFGKQAMRLLCCNTAFKGLKSINLANNPLGSEGIKLISEVSNWSELQVLILANTKSDYQGMKFLAMNESWVSLRELDLSQNPLIGDFGAAMLSLNRSWTQLKKLALCGCNIESQRIKSLTRNKMLKNLFIIDKNTLNPENQFGRDQEEKLSKICSNLNRKSFKQLEKSLLNHYPSTINNEKLKGLSSHFRGGFPQATNGENGNHHSQLFAKIKQYREKILGDVTLLKESRNYIQARASIPSKSEEAFELAPAIGRNFLNTEDSDVTKVLLITGAAGVGKSFFCTHFHRELLAREDFKSQVLSTEAWLPIYVDLSSLKNPKSEAISETLARELSLNSEEIHLLQTSEPSNVSLPRLLFIFDSYSNLGNSHSLHALFSDQDFASNNFCALNRINESSWKNAKFIIACREGDLEFVKRRDLLFAPLSSGSAELSSVPGSFLQMKIEPFTNDQITWYLKKYLFWNPPAANGENKAQPASKFSLWSEVQKYEKMLDDLKLREVARTPFMLWVLCHILPNLVEMHIKKLRKPLTNRCFLISYFIDHVMASIAKKNIGTARTTRPRTRGSSS